MAADDSALEDLARRVGAALEARRWTLASAESCTGGWIAKVMTDVAGSSAWFDRGFVTYSNEAKQELLGVSAGSLRAHGAVSEAVARELALGALVKSRADIVVAVTGIAGPGGGSAAKPVGLVWFAWARREGLIEAECRLFEGDREAVRRQAVAHALTGVLSRSG